VLCGFSTASTDVRGVWNVPSARIVARSCSGDSRPRAPGSPRVWSPWCLAAPPRSCTMMCAVSSTTSSVPRSPRTARAIWFPIVAVGRYTASSWPSSSAPRRSSSRTVGSSRSCSSPTSAAAIASRIAREGFVCVSERRSITLGTLRRTEAREPRLELRRGERRDLALLEAERGNVAVAREPLVDHAERKRQQRRHPLLDDRPEARVLRDEPREEVHAVGDVARLVLLDQAQPLAQAGHQPTTLEPLEVRVVAGLGEHAFDDEVVGDRRGRLRCGRRVAEEGVHRLRQLDLEELPVALAVEAREALRRAAHLVQEAAEELRVLPLLEEECREEELLLEPALPR